VLEHPSTVGGLAFDAKGKRLAVAHYGGMTLWEEAKRGWKASKFVWKGSHRAVTLSPDGRFAITSMQEPALHGWRLRDKADMRMSGYPGRVRSMAWVGGGALLATSGADAAICWPCDGPNGPMGRPPVMVGQRDGVRVSAVCGLPDTPFVLAGFEDGLVLAAELTDGAPGRLVTEGNGAAVAVLAATADARHLLVGDANGRLAWFTLRG
jgi:WD40 repeat protein